MSSPNPPQRRGLLPSLMAIVALAVHLRMYYLLAQVLATVLVMGFTFTLNRVWTFR